MTALATIVLPVFIVLGFGYAARWRGYFDDAGIDGLMKFTQWFAIPCLLFKAIATIDLAAGFDPGLLGAFYGGALSGFVVGYLGARHIFKRTSADAIAIGFVGLFSNSVLLGLPIMERAYGVEALAGNFAIIAMHAPFCYLIGITCMEVSRARATGTSLRKLPRIVGRAIFRNALIIGITLGLIVNLSGMTLPGVLMDAIDLMIRAALPAALFGLGGILYRYKPEGDIRAIVFITGVSLVVHPTITYGLGRAFGLSDAALRSAVITAAMAPGVNAYLFANIYGAARRVAASAVLVGTGMCIFTATFWLTVLP